MQRRLLLTGAGFSLLGWVLPMAAQTAFAAGAATSADAVSQLLTRGGCAVLLRHTQTEPGVGDPAGFRLDVCSSQRNLNSLGIQQARRIGQWFKNQNLQPRAVRSSAWCRCQDTAQLAFGSSAKVVVWPALNSFFGDSSNQEPAQSADLRQALAEIPAGVFEVWVTHQVNITALTGDVPAMGEARVVQLAPQGKMQLVLPLRFD